MTANKQTGEIPEDLAFFRELSDDELAVMWVELAEFQRSVQPKKAMVESIMWQRMMERDATAYAEHGLVIASAPTRDVDRSHLSAILELAGIPPDKLDEAHTPAHERLMQVPATWNMTKTKALVKYNGAVADIIERATVVGALAPTFKLAQKGGA